MGPDLCLYSPELPAEYVRSIPGAPRDSIPGTRGTIWPEAFRGCFPEMLRGCSGRILRDAPGNTNAAGGGDGGSNVAQRLDPDPAENSVPTRTGPPENLAWVHGCGNGPGVPWDLIHLCLFDLCGSGGVRTNLEHMGITRHTSRSQPQADRGVRIRQDAKNHMFIRVVPRAFRKGF